MSLVGVNLSGAEFAPQNDPGTYNVDYTYPTHQEIDYYAGKGMTVIRLPFLMDRMQGAANGPLNTAQLGYMDDVVNYAASKGLKVILDTHDYGYEHGTLIADPASDAAFANFWGQMAAHYKGNAAVMFGLENEPNVQTAAQWLPAANAAIAAIRGAGATQEILVPAISWQSAAQFTSDGSSTTLAQGIKDPSNNYAFEVHQYLDADASGTSTNIANGDLNIGPERLQAITQWAQQTGNKLFLGEIGVGTDSASTTALNNTLAYMQQNANVWQGVTYFAGGPWWGSTALAIEPSGLGTSTVTDRPQMAVLAQYAPSQASTPPATPVLVPTPVATPVATLIPVVVPTPVATSIPALTPVAATPTVLGSSSHKLALMVSEDAWQGDAQFTVAVDGVQVGGTQTATASHGAGASQEFDVLGSFGAGPHTATLNFINDAYGGTAATDRNLYVDGASLDGAAVAGAAAPMLSGGPRGFAFSVPAPVASSTGAATTSSDALQVNVSEDAWQGDAQFTVSVDGTQVGGVQTATTLHSSGQTQAVTLSGTFGAGSHSVAVSFINDAYGGTPSTDRNLYVQSAAIEGAVSTSPPATLLSNGTATFNVAVPNGQVPVPVPTSALTLHLSEDAWNGDAQFTATVDGKSLGAAQSVTALHALGQTQDFAFAGQFGIGTHDLAVSFINDAYGGTPSTDRNLYVNSVSLNTSTVPSASATLLSNGTVHFQFVVPS